MILRSMQVSVLAGLALWICVGSIASWEISVTATEAAQGEERQDAQAATAASADKPSADASWSEGLKLGVNGPIPFIVVDQFGYPTKSSKVAVIRNHQVGYDKDASFKPGREYRVVERSTGKIVKSGTL